MEELKKTSADQADNTQKANSSDVLTEKELDGIAGGADPGPKQGVQLNHNETMACDTSF